jgi:type IV secretion system protein TrbL
MGVFNCISSQFYSVSQGWAAKLTGYATNLFALLAAIEFAWAGITYALEKDSPNTLLAMFAKKLMTIGFFYVLLLKGPGWMQDVVTSFQQAGGSAGGVQSISPTSIVGIGMNCAWAIYGGLSDLGIADRIGLALPCGIAALVTMIAFVIVAGQMFITLVESYIVTGAGILFLGFGASRFTSDFTKKYITYGMSVGVKLFVITLIVGVGQQFTGTWAQMLNSSPGDIIHTSMIVAGGALLYAMVAWQIPSFAQSLMSGAASLSAGTAMASAAGVAGAATGVAMAGAAAVTEGVTSIAGAAQATNAGIGLARAAGTSGASVILQGVGKAVGGMAREAVSSIGLSGAISNSLGGRVATSINERAAALKSASVVPPPANGIGGVPGGERPNPGPTGGSPTARPIRNGRRLR